MFMSRIKIKKNSNNAVATPRLTFTLKFSKNQVQNNMKNIIITISIALTFLLTSCSSKINKDNKEIFGNGEYYSREATIWGHTGRTVVLFRKNEYTKFENTITVRYERKVNGTMITFGEDGGKWTWADSTNRTINVEMPQGITHDYSGIWKFDENFSSVECPTGITLFNH